MHEKKGITVPSSIVNIAGYISNRSVGLDRFFLIRCALLYIHYVLGCSGV